MNAIAVATRSWISRSADHRYTYDGMVVPGVTTVLGALDKSGPLMNWAARETATAAVKQVANLPSLLETVGPDGVIKMLSSRSAWQRDEKAAQGTEIHSLADLLVNGRLMPEMTDGVRNRVQRYADWWQSAGWTLRLSEAMIFSRTGFGGTFDLLARDRDGRTVLADIKSGRAVYREAVLQLAAYGMADYVQPGEVEIGVPPTVYAMPEIDRYAILHVTENEVREVEISVGQLERVAFLACLTLHEWTETMKGKRL